MKEHFRWTLTTHFLGGDISHDYPFQKVLGFMEEMGCGMGDHPDDIAPLDDERWNSVMGQEVLADLRQSGYVDDES